MVLYWIEGCATRQSQHSAVEGLCEAPHDCPAKWCIVLIVYLDESGTHSDEYTVVAGFVGKKRHWSKFEKAWKEGLGNRPFLHLSTMGFTNPTEKQWLEKLGSIPYECGLKPVYGGVCRNDYLDLAKGTVGEVHGQAAPLCLVPIVDGLISEIPGDERFEFIFEASNLEFYFCKMMRMIASFPGLFRYDKRPRAAHWEFMPKSESSRFQPGDYLANHLWNWNEDSNSIRSQWTLPIASNRKLIGGRLERDRARNLFKHLAKDEYTKGIPREEIKEYRRRVRNRKERDPWDEMLKQKQ